MNETATHAVAVTDNSNFFGLVKFHKAAFGAGVKPVFGVDLQVIDANDNERSYPITLLGNASFG